MFLYLVRLENDTRAWITNIFGSVYVHFVSMKFMNENMLPVNIAALIF